MENMESGTRRSKRLKRSASLSNVAPSKPSIRPMRRTISTSFKKTKANASSLSQKVYADRLMPMVSLDRLDHSGINGLSRNSTHLSLLSPKSPSDQSTSSPTDAYSRRLSLATGIMGSNALLHYSSFISSPPPLSVYAQPRRDLKKLVPKAGMESCSTDDLLKTMIPSAPERILDAPGLRDDYYISVLDWSALNVVAVALDATVYLWKETEIIHTVESSDYVSCLSFSRDGQKLAIGSHLGSLIVYHLDPQNGIDACESPFCFSRFPGGISSLVFGSQDEIMIGTPSGSLCIFDRKESRRQGVSYLRTPRDLQSVHNDRIVRLVGSGQHSMIAAGGNDNLVSLWDLSDSKNALLVHVLSDHISAVRGLSWCPWEDSLLMTGGGMNDQTVRIYNTATGTCTGMIQTEAQVTAVQWSHNSRQLLIAASVDSDQLSIWSYPGLQKVGQMPGHESRPLHLAISPTGEYVVSAAPDENLKFWKCFPPKERTMATRARSSRPLDLIR